MAKALAQQVKKVQRRFDEDRRALRTVQDPGGKPAYLRREVIDLIDRTGKDLDQAIEQVGEADLDPLRAWAIEKLRRVQEELVPPSDRRTAALPAAVARIASLGSLPSPGPASVIAAVPKQETISAETSNRLLDQVGAVVSRIFFLAEAIPDRRGGGRGLRVIAWTRTSRVLDRRRRPCHCAIRRDR